MSARPGNPQDGAAIEELKQRRINDQQPRAIVVTSRNESLTYMSVYANEDSQSTENSRVEWKIVRERHGYATIQTEMATSNSCPSIYGLALSLERLAIPRPEIRTERPSSPVGFTPLPPNLGPVHQHYTFWSRGWTQTEAPVELLVSHLGAGPVADWVDAAETALAPCWTEAPPPHSIASAPR